VVFVGWHWQSCNTWRSNDGTRLVLTSPACLLQLTELERLTLQKVALAHIHALELGTRINIPKGSSHHALQLELTSDISVKSDIIACSESIVKSEHKNIFYTPMCIGLIVFFERDSI